MKKTFKKILGVTLASTMLMSSCALAAFAGTGSTDYTIVNPYETVDWDTYDTYKACLHVHTNASDGDPTLDEMVQGYYDAGYDILAITDHGVINNGWTKEKTTNGIFNGFRKVYPMSEEQYERFTTGSDRGGRGITDITGGVEINMAVISKTHVNGYFTTYGQGVWGFENDYETAPKRIEAAGGYSVLNHVGDWVNSNNFPARSHQDGYISYFANIFTSYKTCLGMEIVNNTDNVSRSDRALWDELLEVVIPTGRNIWAFADDDSEQLDEIGRAFELFPLAENNEENVKQAMINGAFFAASKNKKAEKNSGEEDFEGNGNVPVVTDIEVNQEENTISVSVSDDTPCDKISWIANGKVISNDYTIDLNDFESEIGCYVRFELMGEGGVTYSQAFEVQYEGRPQKMIPEAKLQKAAIDMSHTHIIALWALIIEKIAMLFGII